MVGRKPRGCAAFLEPSLLITEVLRTALCHAADKGYFPYSAVNNSVAFKAYLTCSSTAAVLGRRQNKQRGNLRTGKDLPVC